MDLINKILKIIKEKNGGQEIDFDQAEYHVFLKNAHVLIYVDSESESLKVNVEMFNEGCAQVVFADVKFEDLM